MKIAVTYKDGLVGEHFGKSECFKIYEIADGKIVSKQVVATEGQGHGEKTDFLVKHGIDTLLCGKIGACARSALDASGISLYDGIAGDANRAVDAFLNGTLGSDPAMRCMRHEHENHSSHTCCCHKERK